eukprot:28812-Eustigmatos_ZCMA.PRE.1
MSHQPLEKHPDRKMCIRTCCILCSDGDYVQACGLSAVSSKRAGGCATSHLPCLTPVDQQNKSSLGGTLALASLPSFA